MNADGSVQAALTRRTQSTASIDESAELVIGPSRAGVIDRVVVTVWNRCEPVRASARTEQRHRAPPASEARPRLEPRYAGAAVRTLDVPDPGRTVRLTFEHAGGRVEPEAFSLHRLPSAREDARATAFGARVELELRAPTRREEVAAKELAPAPGQPQVFPAFDALLDIAGALARKT